jgi:hypothetical protein
MQIVINCYKPGGVKVKPKVTAISFCFLYHTIQFVFSLNETFIAYQILKQLYFSILYTDDHVTFAYLLLIVLYEV